MVVSFWHQQLDQTLPLAQVGAYTASQLPIDLVDVPVEFQSGTVTAVSVTVTNANGVSVTGSATKVTPTHWRVIFASSNFATYGFVTRGFKAVATITREDETTDSLILGIGDLNIVASSASASPGSTDNTYEVKGGDRYFKSQVVGGVQHYVKQVISYDAAIGWGADWTGDYILVNGEFVEAN